MNAERLIAADSPPRHHAIRAHWLWANGATVIETRQGITGLPETPRLRWCRLDTLISCVVLHAGGGKHRRGAHRKEDGGRLYGGQKHLINLHAAGWVLV